MWHDDIIQTVHILLRELGRGLPKILSILFRLGTLFLFFWYLVDFIRELWSHQRYSFAIVGVVSALLTTALCGWTLFNARRAVRARMAGGSGSMLSFVVLNFPCLVVVATATWYGHSFGAGLLHFTQCLLKRLFAIL